MLGNDRNRIILQPRDERLLRELAAMRVIDREQTKIVAGFRSTTRANVRLLSLLNAGLLRRFFQGTTAGGKKSLYSLSTKGSRLIGVADNGLRHPKDELLIANFFVTHQMAVNEIYCVVKYRPIPIPDVRFGCWLWLSEQVSPAIPLIPDGYFEMSNQQGTVAAFIEVDLGNEGAAVWRKKIANYLRYATSGKFEEQFRRDRFRVLVIANSERRAQAIRKVVRGLTDKIFWFSTFDAIQREGFWCSVWLRPAENMLRSFF
jgi:hypothetical protein